MTKKTSQPRDGKCLECGAVVPGEGGRLDFPVCPTCRGEGLIHVQINLQVLKSHERPDGERVIDDYRILGADVVTPDGHKMQVLAPGEVSDAVKRWTVEEVRRRLGLDDNPLKQFRQKYLCEPITGHTALPHRMTVELLSKARCDVLKGADHIEMSGATWEALCKDKDTADLAAMTWFKYRTRLNESVPRGTVDVYPSVPPTCGEMEAKFEIQESHAASDGTRVIDKARLGSVNLGVPEGGVALTCNGKPLTETQIHDMLMFGMTPEKSDRLREKVEEDRKLVAYREDEPRNECQPRLFDQFCQRMQRLLPAMPLLPEKIKVSSDVMRDLEKDWLNEMTIVNADGVKTYAGIPVLVSEALSPGTMLVVPSTLPQKLNISIEGRGPSLAEEATLLAEHLARAGMAGVIKNIDTRPCPTCEGRGTVYAGMCSESHGAFVNCRHCGGTGQVLGEPEPGNILQGFDELAAIVGDAFKDVCGHRFTMEQRTDGDPCYGCPNKEAAIADGREFVCPYGKENADGSDR